MPLDLKKLREKVDEALANETDESLIEWLTKQRDGNLHKYDHIENEIMDTERLSEAYSDLKQKYYDLKMRFHQLKETNSIYRRQELNGVTLEEAISDSHSKLIKKHACLVASIETKKV